MSLLKPAKLSPWQIERRKRTKAKGRKHFILVRGILGWGGLMFITNTMFYWCDEFGWHVPHGGLFYFQLFFGLVIYPTAGYFWAAWLWKKYYENFVP